MLNLTCHDCFEWVGEVTFFPLHGLSMPCCWLLHARCIINVTNNHSLNSHRSADLPVLVSGWATSQSFLVPMLTDNAAWRIVLQAKLSVFWWTIPASFAASLRCFGMWRMCWHRLGFRYFHSTPLPLLFQRVSQRSSPMEGYLACREVPLSGNADGCAKAPVALERFHPRPPRRTNVPWDDGHFLRPKTSSAVVVMLRTPDYCCWSVGYSMAFLSSSQLRWGGWDIHMIS